MTDKPSGLKEHVRGAWHWVKVVALVVLITLIVILVLQNLGESAVVVFIVPRWETSSAMVVAVAFLAGVVVTLLVVFLRRGFRK
ncbi:MAG TPA: hypothetical protein VMZ92_05065 [Planctomycetota bacterium]|nr:hypothetical protein [Planctomycetota bacterium]